MNNHQTKTWEEYEAGKEYKRRIGLYETVRRNERFYRGDQWHGAADDLPHPVFNLIRRIVDYLVGAVLPGELEIRYSDDRLPFLDNSARRFAVTDGLRLLEKNAAYRWKQNHMTDLVRKALLDAAITGDGVFYCWWDDRRDCGQPFLGDIRTDLVDNTNFFVADVNNPDVQSQDYVILAGRATAASLRREAEEAGVSPKEIALIVGDSRTETQAGDLSSVELDGAEKTTYLIKFFREDGEVVFEKSTRDCVIRRVHTGLRLYPVAYFNWGNTKNCYHGTAPVSELIPNQKYINSAYALAMKHMSDTAFSKIIYDKTRIPEWTNEVGEAIAAVGGGTVSDAVSVVGVGKMQEGYLDLIDSVIENTKNMMGATESALGDAEANNTSAILALQEASQIALVQVNAKLCRAIGELASIWADMLCAYCPAERLLPYEDSDGLHTEAPDYTLLRGELLRATAEAGNVNRFTPSATVSTLNRLLEGGYLNIRQYLESLPNGCIADRETLLAEIQMKGTQTNE